MNNTLFKYNFFQKNTVSKTRVFFCVQIHSNIKGRFHHSKKAHSEGRKNNNNKFAAGKIGNKKLDEDFVYTQKHKFGILFAISWTKNLLKKI